MLLLFLTCAGLLLWCYAGYPLAMAGRARLSPRPWRVESSGWDTSVSIVLAVRNAATLIERRLANLLSLSMPAGAPQIIVVCNGCTDDTEARARAVAEQNPSVLVMTSPAEQGKAGALNAGVREARGAFIVFADARQRFEPEAVERLLAPFADPAVAGVSGRLVIGAGGGAAVHGARLYWGLETRLRTAESQSGSVPGVTGAIWAVRRGLFPPLPPGLILDDVYVPVRLAMAGYRIVLAPDSVAYDAASVDDKREFARKKRTMVGNLQIIRLLPGVLNPKRNAIFARYFSHKLMRLASPFCMLGLVVSSAFLPGAVFRVMFWFGLLLYLLGFLGLILRTRALAIPAALVMVQLAIIAAIVHFRGDAAAVWMDNGEVARSRMERR